MRAEILSDLLKAGDRVAVSNITGREASTVSVISQGYCGNIVGGWALGKGGQKIDIPGGNSMPVYATVQEFAEKLSPDKHPNKVIVYSPPQAVYGDVKEIVEHLKETVETLFIVTEHVSIEVTAKIAQLCRQENIDVLGCNSLGMINTHDGVRTGAVGGDNPQDSFSPGSVCIISNSGNMVNTMASYLLSAGMGTSYGISTGKDMLIMTPLKQLLGLAEKDDKTKLIVCYIEPGGLYEKEAVEMLVKHEFSKPLVVYVTGEVLQKMELSLGHAGAVVEGKGTSATAKMEMFDDYFGVEPFNADRKYPKTVKAKELLKKGIRIKTLHHLPAAVSLVCNASGIKRDFKPSKPLKLNPWFVNFSMNKTFEKEMDRSLLLYKGVIPRAYIDQVKLLSKDTLGAVQPKRNMRNTSHVSSNDGYVTRICGYSVENLMSAGSFTESLLLSWLGERPDKFEVELLEKCLIASLTNGPGTISAQGAKLSTSAGNSPNTTMIATLACLGDVHGGNGQRAVKYLAKIFTDIDISDPWRLSAQTDLQSVIDSAVHNFVKQRNAAKEAGISYDRIPCLGHPVFNRQPVNYDPRERVISSFIEQKKMKNVFLEFYHGVAHKLKEVGIARNVWAVNLDGAIASVVFATCYKALREKRISLSRVCDIAFMIFAVGRAAGATAEYLDHKDFGSPMDMRIPVTECISLTRAKD